MLPEHDLHILISDIGMPEAGGCELISAIRCGSVGDKVNRGIPAIRSRHLLVLKTKKKALRTGFRAPLVKPADAQERLKVAEGLLEKP